MLYENDVVDSVSNFLTANGFLVRQQLLSTEKGDDIVAFCPQRKVDVYIEAKGETSAVLTSKRYGIQFSPSQVKDHVANAFYRAAKMYSKNQDCLVGIALPRNPDHLNVVNQILPVLKILSIEVFWVDSDLQVSVLNHWP